MGELDTAISLDDAAHWLGIAIEAVVENYGEYVDYNSITTQSDRGDMLYTLLDFLRLARRLRPAGLEPPAGGGGAEASSVAAGGAPPEMWSRAVAQRTAPMANDHLRRFDALCGSTECGCRASPNISPSGSSGRWRSTALCTDPPGDRGTA